MTEILTQMAWLLLDTICNAAAWFNISCMIADAWMNVDSIRGIFR